MIVTDIKSDVRQRGYDSAEPDEATPVAASVPEAAPASGVAAAKRPLVLAPDAVTATLLQVGGKCASLARLARAGFPVPPGFLITTEAYRAFVDTNALQDSIVSLANDATRPTEDTSTDIRALFDSASTPPELVGEIQRVYADLTRATGDASPFAGLRACLARQMVFTRLLVNHIPIVLLLRKRGAARGE